ncbi:hypothetical protein Hanom_Chr16g01494911 [Helianthus anomalus]
MVVLHFSMVFVSEVISSYSFIKTFISEECMYLNEFMVKHNKIYIGLFFYLLINASARVTFMSNGSNA